MNAHSPRRFRWPSLALGLLAVLALAWLALLLWVQPSNQREWSPDQAQLATAVIDGDSLTIRNVRNARYHSTSQYVVIWEQRHYDL